MSKGSRPPSVGLRASAGRLEAHNVRCTPRATPSPSTSPAPCFMTLFTSGRERMAGPRGVRRREARAGAGGEFRGRWRRGNL